MPLVRIDVRKGKDAAYRQEIGRVVYEALVGVGAPKILEQAIRRSRSPGIVCYLHHDHHDHPGYAGRLECRGRWFSGDAGQRRLPDEGCGPLCCIVLFAEAGCRPSIAFEPDAKKSVNRISAPSTRLQILWLRRVRNPGLARKFPG